MGKVNLRDTDLEWLASNLPELTFRSEAREIVGVLRFCAAYDRDAGQLRLGDSTESRAFRTFLCDAFKVRIDLDRVADNGWPEVRETGGRCFDIAEQNQCEMIDLHLFTNGACCLGLKWASEKNLTLERFICDLVIPFFYRLSYADRYGLTAAKVDLWGEYSHGIAGIQEYREEILRIAGANPSRNRACPCGSGSKYKRCHLDEVEVVQRTML